MRIFLNFRTTILRLPIDQRYLSLSVKREEKEGVRLNVAGISEVPVGTQNGTSLLNPLTSVQLAGFFRGNQA